VANEPETSRVNIVSIGGAGGMSKSQISAHANRDPTLGMTSRMLMFSDRQVTLRPYTNSSTFVRRTVFWLLLPVLIVLAFLLVISTVLLLQQNTLRSTSSRMGAVQLTTNHLNQYASELLELMVSNNATDWPALYSSVKDEG